MANANPHTATTSKTAKTAKTAKSAKSATSAASAKSVKSTKAAKPPTTAKATKAKPAKTARKITKLHYCDLRDCQGICCSDGAFLRPEEVRRVHKLVEKYPEHFSHLDLPLDYIIDEEWAHGVGKKTNVRKFRYRNKPEHFKHTKCVFAESDGKCSFQTLAIKQGVHKWKYKPMGCWLFPLESDEKGLVSPPRTRKDDPNNLDAAYPGFATFTPCGKHSEKGKVWWIALKEEVAEYKRICPDD